MKVPYGFYGRLKKEFPSQIIVDVNNKCNLSCVHCPQSDKSRFKEVHYLDESLNKKMIDEIQNYGKDIVQHIRYTANGEPLLHPRLFDMIKEAVKNSGAFVSLTTNGNLLNDEKIVKLLNTGVKLIDVSIDAYSRDTYEKIRVNGEFNILNENVKNLIKYNKLNNNKAKIIVSFVEQELNKNEVQLFKNYWETEGVDTVVIRRLHTAAGSKNILKLLDDVEERTPCVYPWERIILNCEGFLQYCPNCFTNDTSIIDYRKTSIYEIWQSDFYNKLRKAHLDNNYGNFSFCNQCPDWKQIRWPNEGKGYGDLINEFNK